MKLSAHLVRLAAESAPSAGTLAEETQDCGIPLSQPARSIIPPKDSFDEAEQYTNARLFVYQHDLSRARVGSIARAELRCSRHVSPVRLGGGDPPGFNRIEIAHNAGGKE